MNRVIIAVAGAGKTTSLVEEIKENVNEKILIVTYTNNNVDEIKLKMQDKGALNSNVIIKTWYNFILTDILRPYQTYILDSRIESINFPKGTSAKYISKSNFNKYFFYNGNEVFSDKSSELGIICNEKSSGKVISRLEALYSRLYIDEVQDISGYDIELLEEIMKSKIKVTLIGDHRQATYQTNYSPKNSAFRGEKIIKKFINWDKEKIVSLSYSQNSYRCNQAICDLSSSLYPDFPNAISKNKNMTTHDGVFILRKEKLADYMAEYKPKVLRYDRSTDCYGYDAINWGESKGLTFDRILIIPHGPLKAFLKTNDLKLIKGSLSKVYVAITRARHSVCFLYDGEVGLKNYNIY